MKPKRLVLIGILLCLMVMLSHNASAQGCGATLQAHFSIYRTFGVNGKTIYQTVEVDGYADVFPGPGCPMGSAIHTPRIENKLGSSGGWYSGPRSSASGYVSFSNNQQIIGAPGVVYFTETTAQMNCSLAGTFWGTPVATGKLYPLVTTNCAHPNPVTGIDELDGAWGIPGGCNKTDALPEASGTCVTEPGPPLLHCHQTTSGSCTTTDCPGAWRAINSACSQFISSFPIEESQACIH